MLLPAPLAVAVEVRAQDVGPRLDRVWRLSRAIGEEGLRLGRDLPYAPGRPVQVALRLPDDQATLEAHGVVEAVAPDSEQEETARPRAVRFTRIDPADRQRLLRYVEERVLEP